MILQMKLLLAKGIRRALLNFFCYSHQFGPRCFQVSVLLLIGFSLGVMLNQFGFVFEAINVQVKLRVNKDGSSNASLINQLLIELPHTDNETLHHSSSSSIVPNIVHYVWLALLFFLYP